MLRYQIKFTGQNEIFVKKRKHLLKTKVGDIFQQALWLIDCIRRKEKNYFVML